jgi:ribA/ribD-fused uncharacterized protein
MKYSQDWLIRQLSNDERIKYLFFWGHQPRKDGQISATCLSQWWVAPFVVEGTTYLTAEHWMMAGKAKLFGDIDILHQILLSKTPAEAKKLGRQVAHFEANKWDQHKFQLVVEGNWHKFSQHAELKGFLLETGNRVLVEASPVDRIWGIGMANDHPDVENPSKWKGENLLGFALMEVRDLLEENSN